VTAVAGEEVDQRVSDAFEFVWILAVRISRGTVGARRLVPKHVTSADFIA
jgi:hypothetical protein